MLRCPSDEILAAMTSILYLSITKNMADKTPHLFAEQTVNCASSPQMVSITLEEVHIWNPTGTLIVEQLKLLLLALGLGLGLPEPWWFDDPSWSHKNASLVVLLKGILMVCNWWWGLLIREDDWLSVGKMVVLWCLSCFLFSRAWRVLSKLWM